jgi:tetratricopeptide (TPR) repeat protein
MNEQANPYIAGPSVMGAAFYGRKDVFRFVNESLNTPQQRVIVLYGQRCIGKTSILLELPRHLPSDEFHCVYFDLQDRANHPLPRVLHQLAVKIAQSLSTPEPPESSTDDESYLQDHFLPSVYQVLEGKRLVLLFDEFNVLEQETLVSNAASTTLFPYLQRLIAQEPQLAFIFVVGRRIDELPARFQAILKQARYMRVSLLRGQDAVELITQPARDQLTYTREAIEAILGLTAGHPYFTQATCHEIFFLMKYLGKKRVSPNDVDITFGNAIESSKKGFSWFWDGLPRAERLFLSAVAQIADEADVATESTICQILSKHDLSLLDIELHRVPHRLIEWEVLSLESDDSYRFVIELLRRWVAKEHPLQKAKQQRALDKRAMRSYDNARTAHRRGHFKTAIVYYRQALAARPSHMEAQLGLARALHEQGELAQAVHEYEKAFELDPTNAQDELIAARLIFAQSLEEQGQFEEAAEQYHRALELSPLLEKQVQEKLAELYGQGMDYANQRQWREAVTLFERVQAISPEHEKVSTHLKNAKGQLAAQKRSRMRLAIGAVAILLLGLGLSFALPALRKLLPTAPLVPTEVVLLPSLTRTPSLTSTSLPTPTEALVTTPGEATPTPTSIPPPVTDAATLTTAATDTLTPTPTLNQTETPMPTPTSITMVVTATPAPLPIPTPFPAPRLTGPENGHKFLEGEAATIILQWERVGPLVENEWYQVILSFFKLGEIQYAGARIKETEWQAPEYFYGQADQPERAHYWNVTVIQVNKAPDGNETSIERSPPSETWIFYWP